VNRSLRFLAPLLLLPTLAWAGGTGVRMTLVPVPAVCGSGATCRNGKPGACTVDVDCDVGMLAPRSKLSFSGKKLKVTASLSGVTDASGALVTTDGVSGSSDDYILTMHATICDWADVLGCTPTEILTGGVSLKVDLGKGKGKLKVDLSGLLSGLPDGLALAVHGAELRLPPTNPASCPGDNSSAGLSSRVNVAACQTGALVGMGGFLKAQ
jgi:hypothetical protein